MKFGDDAENYRKCSADPLGKKRKLNIRKMLNLHPVSGGK